MAKVTFNPPPEVPKPEGTFTLELTVLEARVVATLLGKHSWTTSRVASLYEGLRHALRQAGADNLGQVRAYVTSWTQGSWTQGPQPIGALVVDLP